MAINTQAGAFPNTIQERYQRRQLIVASVIQAASQGAKVIVLPEQLLGWWEDKVDNPFFYGALGSEIHRNGLTVVVGAQLPVAGSHTLNTNNMVVMSTDGLVHVSARQAVPVSMWRPWSDETTLIHWAKTNIQAIQGRPTLFSICYEDFLPALSLTSFMVGPRPEVVISTANAWWVTTDEIELQAQHIEQIGTIFHVPVVRAVNRG